jgi:hypothetical protein
MKNDWSWDRFSFWWWWTMMHDEWLSMMMNDNERSMMINIWRWWMKIDIQIMKNDIGTFVFNRVWGMWTWYVSSNDVSVNLYLNFLFNQFDRSNAHHAIARRSSLSLYNTWMKIDLIVWNERIMNTIARSCMNNHRSNGNNYQFKWMIGNVRSDDILEWISRDRERMNGHVEWR